LLEKKNRGRRQESPWISYCNVSGSIMNHSLIHCVVLWPEKNKWHNAIVAAAKSFGFEGLASTTAIKVLVELKRRGNLPGETYKT